MFDFGLVLQHSLKALGSRLLTSTAACYPGRKITREHEQVEATKQQHANENVFRRCRIIFNFLWNIYDSYNHTSSINQPVHHKPHTVGWHCIENNFAEVLMNFDDVIYRFVFNTPYILN